MVPDLPKKPRSLVSLRRLPTTLHPRMWGRRPGWKQYWKRYWWRRRRYRRRGYGYFRSRRPWYYRRRHTVRRRRRRFRHRRRRRGANKVAITQWNPGHRTICRIKGWEPFVFAAWQDLDQKFSLLKVFQRPHHYFDYGIQGGSFDLRTYTLDQFYHKHLLGWNRWTRSNEGYDLARYFGTTWTFYPHPHQPYIVFWQRNWDTTEFEQLPRMHPAWLLTHPRNTVLVLPRSWHGKKKKIRIKPPSLQTSQWWFASSWVGIALFRIGVTPINLENPFVHKTSSTTQPFYCPWIGWGQAPVMNQTKPLPVKWTYASFSGMQTARVNYRWWWDTGYENYILINSGHMDPTNNPTTTLDVIQVNYPYYVFFYGAMLPQGKDQVQKDSDVGTNQPKILGKTNPSPLAIWWYFDKTAYYMPDTVTPQMDTRYLRPEDLPNQGRNWVWLSDVQPGGSRVQFQDDINMKSYWTSTVIAPFIQKIVENSPFVMGRFDIPFGNREFNVTAKYSSTWQWGGLIPKPDTVQDPETLHDVRPPQSSVRNPATVGAACIHPWDLTQGGTINELKLRTILTNILTPPGPAPPSTGRPASPSPRRARTPRRRRKRRRSPSPPESSENEGQESSASSGRRSETPSSSSSSEEEESPPKKVPFVLRRRPLLR